MIPELLSIVKAPVVVSEASALRKFPPAMTEADVFDVLDTFRCVAEVVAPSNTAPRLLLSVNPELIVGNPLVNKGEPSGDPASGVNVSFERTATLMLPTYMEEITLLTVDAVTVSIFQPDSVCPEVYCGPTNIQADPV